MVELFVNSEDPDQTPHYAESDLGLHCLQITLLGGSRLQWVKSNHIWQQKQILFVQSALHWTSNHPEGILVSFLFHQP